MVTGLQGYRVTGLQGYRVTGLEGYRATGLYGQGLKSVKSKIVYHRINKSPNNQITYSSILSLTSTNKERISFSRETTSKLLIVSSLFSFSLSLAPFSVIPFSLTR